jgi:hypothetical protein
MYENRIQLYNLVQDFLGKHIHKDIKYSLEKDGETYKIGDFLQLTEQIGTNSKFGVIYKTSPSNSDLVFTIISKLMKAAPKGNVNETRLNQFVSSLVEKRLSRHFLMSYKTFPDCVPICDGLPELIGKSKYFIVLNEEADGDLKGLLTNTELLADTNTLFNVYTQCILSIATLHSYGFIHNDCHWGNFLLLADADEDAYFHYSVYDKDYYLKSCKYHVVIHDFGLVKKHNNDVLSQNVAIEDYRRMFPFFMLKKDKSLVDAKISGVLTSIDDAHLKNISLLSQTLDEVLIKDHYAKMEKKNEASVILDILDRLVEFNKTVLTTRKQENVVASFRISEDNAKTPKIPRLLKI